MKVRIIINVMALDNAYQARLSKSENDFVKFTIAKSEVGKLEDWGLIQKSDNSSNDRVVYVGEFEFVKEEKS